MLWHAVPTAASRASPRAGVALGALEDEHVARAQVHRGAVLEDKVPVGDGEQPRVGMVAVGVTVPPLLCRTWRGEQQRGLAELIAFVERQHLTHKRPELRATSSATPCGGSTVYCSPSAPPSCCSR